MDMEFTWDDVKNYLNFRKHKIWFESAVPIFDQHPFTFFDNEHSDTEDRHVAMGILGHQLIVVTFTEIEADLIRIISARKATEFEERRYERGY
jgi:uncharacterized DUF497 family protein